MKGHLCPRVSPVLDGRGDRPKKTEWTQWSVCASYFVFINE